MSFWNTLKRAYRTDKYEYEVEESLETVKAGIEKLTSRNSIFNKYNLSGNLYANNKFTLVRSWGFLRIGFIDQNPVTLDGKFYYIKTNLTGIKLEVRPNFIFLIFSILFSIAGILVFVNSLSKEALAYEALCLLLVPPVLSTIAFFNKQSHQKRFEKALGLTNQKMKKA